MERMQEKYKQELVLMERDKHLHAREKKSAWMGSSKKRKKQYFLEIM
jgi:hypothetical protein